MPPRIWYRLFFLASVSLTGLFLLMMWTEGNPEWKSYQVAYHRLLAQRTQAVATARTPLAVRQVHLPEFGRTDRCMTCHLGVGNPAMADAPQPFRTHPDYRVHPVEQYGCTICHGGQGMALTKQDAHGFVKHWERPLLPKPLTVASCAYCHQNLVGLKGAERLVRARQLFDTVGCIGCHTLNGWGGPISTDLAYSAEKPLDEFDFRYVTGIHTAFNWHMEHFKNPQRVNPGDLAANVPPTPMPNYRFTDEETEALTALVLGFAHERIPARFVVPDRAPRPAPQYASAVDAGRAVFQKYGCAACHGMEGRGGVKNYNAATGGEVPPLLYVAQGFTRDQLKELIRTGRYPTKADPKGPTVPLWMPAWKDKLSEEELEHVVEYLVSLYPSDSERN